MTGPKLAVAVVRNEGPFLLEWLAHHRRIGFDDFLIYAAPCMDATPRLLEALAAEGIIRHESLPGVEIEGGFRNYALNAAHSHEAVQNAEWVMALDIDEFLCIHVGNGTLDALLGALGECDLVSLLYRNFGSSGIVRFDDGLITARFTAAEPADLPLVSPPPLTGFKTLFHPDIAARMGPHRPFLLPDYLKGEAEIIWRDGAGNRCNDALLERGWGMVASPALRTLGEVFHYRLRSAEVALIQNILGDLPGSDTKPLDTAHYAQIDTNHESVLALFSQAAALRQDVEALRRIPAIDKAHRQAVTDFKAAIAQRQDSLARGDDRPDIAALLSEARAQTLLDTQRQWLASRRPKAGVKAAAEQPEPADEAPSWLVDFRRSAHRRGFYQSDFTYALQFIDRGSETLILSFDNLSNVSDTSIEREPWGYSFYRKEGWSHLGVMAFEKNWYRDAGLFDALETLSRQRFFARFKRVVLCGTSMGGYAATAFSDLAPRSSVLAFSPQSTLDSAIVPWEARFKSGQQADWSGRYRDAAQLGRSAADINIVYDPYYAPDRRHAERYQGANVRHLKLWYSSHKSALFLRRADLLKDLTREVVAGTLTQSKYYQLVRARRSLIWYYNGLADHALAANRLERADRLAGLIAAQGHLKLADDVRDRINQASSSVATAAESGD